MKRTVKALLGLAMVMCAMASQPVKISLYDGPAPGNRPRPGVAQQIIMSGSDTVYKGISHPTLTLCLPSSPNAARPAIIVCPGGGYEQTSYSMEGLNIAKALNARGIAAFVLNYRLPNDANQTNKAIAPFQDAQRAIQYVRTHAGQLGIDPHKVGMMGFSAGGHLTATAGTLFRATHIRNPLGTSLRPDFMVLAYPLISFDTLSHAGSHIALLGKNASKRVLMRYSLERQVTKSTPPAFIVQCTDDSMVPVQNSLMFYEALLAHGVPAELHLYAVGNHCFQGNPTLDEWLGRLTNWMQLNALLAK